MAKRARTGRLNWDHSRFVTSVRMKRVRAVEYNRPSARQMAAFVAIEGFTPKRDLWLT
ncbi:MAG: hypothetical protein ACI9OJ_001112 [Myxococcota bacterium]